MAGGRKEKLVSKRPKNTPPSLSNASPRPKTHQSAFLLEKQTLSAKPGFLRKLLGPCAVIGVYSPQDKLLFTASTGTDLLGTLRKRDRHGMVWPVLVFPAKSASDLPARCWEPRHMGEYDRKKRDAFLAVAEAKRRSDSQFLLALDSQMRSKDRVPGRKPAHQRMIHALRQVLRGELTKSVAEHADQARGLHAQLRRFCLEVYRTQVKWRAGTNPDWLNKSSWQVLRETFGFAFPEDTKILWEATRRGQKYAERQAKRKANPRRRRS